MWTREQLAALIIEVVWPLLENARRGFRVAASSSASSSSSSTTIINNNGSRVLQFNLSSSTVDTDRFFAADQGVADTVGTAQVFYRAHGGERVTRMTATRTVNDTAEVTLSVRTTTKARNSSANLPTAVSVTIPGPGSEVDRAFDVPLSEGDMLVIHSSASASGRHDVTVEITLPEKSP